MRRLDWIVTPLIVLVLVTVGWSLFSVPGRAEEVDWSELVAAVEAGRVESVVVSETEVTATAKEGEEPARLTATRLPDMGDERFLETLEAQGVKVRGVAPSPSPWTLLLWIGPPLFLLFLLGRLASASRGAGPGGPLSFGRSQAQLVDRSKQDLVTFEDVAGVDEAEEELREVVSYLSDPGRYQALGARIPKGVLLVGPPGTGKTLLARAVAGEARVPFFSLSGSEFVEMFVGVGAARIRDLFAQARERAPCMVFLDELDAVGRSRGGVVAMGTNEEREQTLNQLLAEMDGFDPKANVVIMAATNRPEVLDPALVRPGRFDRQVLVDRPDVKGREEILRVHLRQLVLEPGVDPSTIARRTPGMVGADLAMLANEAALAAARRGAKAIAQQDFEEAIDRVQLGVKKTNRAMTEEEKRRVAFHEAGHALVATRVAHADPVHRVSIIPRSIGALGVTLQLPTEERYLLTREELVDRLCVMMGGRAAEELACDAVSTGAQDDLERATEIARQMVMRWGMSELGPVVWGRREGLRFLDRFGGAEERNFSAETAQAIDREIVELVKSQHDRAVQLLSERRHLLEELARRLITKETLEGAELLELVGASDEDERRIHALRAVPH